MTDTNRSGHAKAWGRALVLGGLMAAGMANPSQAARISNPVASFSGLDKITGRITSFDAYVGETVQFGALQVTPRACFTRDETEAQRVDAFVEVDEITLDRKIRRIFTGWMFADSPALNAVEHPIFDVWLKECKAKSDVPPPPGLKLPPSQPETTGQPAKPVAPQTAPAVPAEPGTDQNPQAVDPSFNQPLNPDDQEALPPLDNQAPQGDVFGQPGTPQYQQDFGSPDQTDPNQPDDGFGDPGQQDGFDGGGNGRNGGGANSNGQ